MQPATFSILSMHFGSIAKLKVCRRAKATTLAHHGPVRAEQAVRPKPRIQPIATLSASDVALPQHYRAVLLHLKDVQQVRLMCLDFSVHFHLYKQSLV